MLARKGKAICGSFPGLGCLSRSEKWHAPLWHANPARSPSRHLRSCDGSATWSSRLGYDGLFSSATPPPTIESGAFVSGTPAVSRGRDLRIAAFAPDAALADPVPAAAPTPVAAATPAADVRAVPRAAPPCAPAAHHPSHHRPVSKAAHAHTAVALHFAALWLLHVRERHTGR